MESREFDDGRRAEFDAWLTNSRSLHDPDSNKWLVLSLSDAKDRLRSWLAEGDYESAREFSEKLSKPIGMTSEERSKSFRVQFPVYAKLVYETVTKGEALTEVIKRRVVSELDAAIKIISVRSDVNKDKLSLLQKEFAAWREAPVEKRRKRRIRGLADASTTQKNGPDLASDLASEVHSPLDYYSPYYLVFPPVPAKALHRLLAESELERYSGDLPREVVETVFKAATTDLEDKGDECADLFDLEMIIEVGKGLTLKINYHDVFVIEEPLDKRFPEYDNDIIYKIGNLGESYADSEGLEYDAAPITVLSVSLKVDDRGLFVHGLPSTEEKEALEKDLLEKLAPTAEETSIKEQVLQAMDNDDMARVAELTRKLEKKKDKREAVGFALKTIVHLVKTSQVVSFRAPDIIIRAWEAYGDPTLAASPTVASLFKRKIGGEGEH